MRVLKENAVTETESAKLRAAYASGFRHGRYAGQLASSKVLEILAEAERSSAERQGTLAKEASEHPCVIKIGQPGGASDFDVALVNDGCLKSLHPELADSLCRLAYKVMLRILSQRQNEKRGRS